MGFALKEKSSSDFKEFMATTKTTHRNIFIPEDLQPQKPRMVLIEKSTVRLIVGRKFW